MDAGDRRTRASGELRPALQTIPVSRGWRLAAAPAGGPRPEDGWQETTVPGTVGGTVGAPREDIDACDWWFVAPLQVPAGGGARLRLGGVATVHDVFLDGEPVHHGESMFASCELPLRGSERELAVCCRALAPRLAERRRPRARWRTALVEHGNLRFFRTMLLGRAPGFAPGPPVIGPWRPVEIVLREPDAARDVRLRARLDGADGRLTLTARTTASGGRLVCAREGSEWAAEIRLEPPDRIVAELRVPDAQRWWPHTHGEPALYAVRLELDGGGDPGAEPVRQELGRIGFRELLAGEQLAERGLDVRVNGVPIFCRGAVWTPLSLTAPHATREELLPVLHQVLAAGMNLLRVPGIATYESDDFHDLCDELGILVWQDCMFANLDYPETDAGFMAEVEREVTDELGRLAHRPSLVAVCGGSEVAQQVAMLGLDPALAAGPLYGELLPRVVDAAAIDAPYVPHAPWGGDLPFRPRVGIANYYGVGAYLRDLTDARLADVRFAAECLAFANVPDDDALPGAAEPLGREWKRGVPRDAGAGWDFDDVRDHYLGALYGVDPAALRYADPGRYRDLSRAVTGEVMARTFGEWRRSASDCTGATVLWLKDLAPGPGWGLLDHLGRPKETLLRLAGPLAPVAVWLTDEGLNGIDVHVCNERAEPLHAELRVTLYGTDGHRADEARVPLELEAHGAWMTGVEALIGGFRDPGFSYRFGPPTVGLLAAALESGETTIAQATLWPDCTPPLPRTAEELGLTARRGEGWVELRAERAVSGVRIWPTGSAAEDLVELEPGRPRRIALRPERRCEPERITARDLRGALRLAG